jgi:hypothetical protein
MKNYLLSRLREASTWRGIIMLATAIGIPIAPALAESIIAAGLAIAGIVGMLIPDQIKQ